MDSTKRRSKIFGKKIQKSKCLPHTGNYLHSICIVFTTIYIVLGIASIHEDVCRLYANTKPFYVRDLSIHKFCYLKGRRGGEWGDGCVLEPIPVHTEGRL